MSEEMTQQTITTPKKTTRKSTAKTPKSKTASKPASSSTTKRKTTAKKTTKTDTITTITPEEKHRMICEAAYYIAERRGFAGGNPEADWLEAETQVQSYLENA